MKTHCASIEFKRRFVLTQPIPANVKRHILRRRPVVGTQNDLRPVIVPDKEFRVLPQVTDEPAQLVIKRRVAVRLLPRAG